MQLCQLIDFFALSALPNFNYSQYLSNPQVRYLTPCSRDLSSIYPSLIIRPQLLILFISDFGALQIIYLLTE